MNKWDLVEDKTTGTMNDYRRYITESIPFLRWAPVVFVSALTKQRVTNLFEEIDKVQKKRHTWLDDEKVDQFWRKAVSRHSPSKGKGPVPPKVLGMKQTYISPPTFDLYIKTKRLDVLHPSWLRYLENKLREEFDLDGTPVIINVKNPTAGAK